MYKADRWVCFFLILIPNIIPIGFVLMTMSFFDIPIDVTTAMITPIMLGIIMDDNIHMLYNFSRFRMESYSMELSINRSINYTGKALLGSTIALTGGFLVIATSSVPSVQNFGILCTITVITALISDFLLLPALLKSSSSN
jgi:predicted RND superfamily exporter protein